jgi:hypothetical protein
MKINHGGTETQRRQHHAFTQCIRLIEESVSLYVFSVSLCPYGCG